MTNLMLAVVSFGLARAEASDEQADRSRFHAQRGDIGIDITDWFASITGSQGLMYPCAPTADDPCDSTCESPIPE